MPKLPADYVKAPSFDNPLRSTAAHSALTEQRVVLRLDEATWNALQSASQHEGCTPEALVLQALEQYLIDAKRGLRAPRAGAKPRSSPRAQLFEQLQQRLMRHRSVQFLLSLRALLRPPSAPDGGVHRA